MKKVLAAGIDEEEYTGCGRFKEWWASYVHLCRANPESIHVKITGSREVQTSRNQYIVYTIDVHDETSNVSWTTERRFREFRQLRNCLLNTKSDIPFPSKRPFALLSRAHYVVVQRKAQLEEFLQKALSLLLSVRDDGDVQDSSFEFAMGIFLGVPANHWKMNENLFEALQSNEKRLFSGLLSSPYSLSRMQVELQEQSPEAVPVLLFCYDFQRFKRKCAEAKLSSTQCVVVESSPDKIECRLGEDILHSFFNELGEHTLRHQQLVEIPPWQEIATFDTAARHNLFESVFSQAEAVMITHFLRFSFDAISTTLDFEQQQLSSIGNDADGDDDTRGRPSSITEWIWPRNDDAHGRPSSMAEWLRPRSPRKGT
jgi:hypothetical protein